MSQLRAGRNKNGRVRVWDRPAFIAGACLVAFSLAWVSATAILSVLPISIMALAGELAVSVLAFLPMFVLALVLLAGMMFELNESSRFASSDLVNWLPVSRREYVAASAASISYIYSPYLCIAFGFALALAIQANMVVAWMASLALSIVSLLTGGLIIEVVRGSINRVYSAMSKKTGKSALIVRLALIILILVMFQAVFNPNLLFVFMNQFMSALDIGFFIPLVWPSLAVLAVIAGDVPRSIIFGLSSITFTLLVFSTAVLVRSKYWSPPSVTIALGNGSSYAPRYSRLGSLGLSDAEASIVAKDLKSYVRQKELVPFLALPFVFAFVLVIQPASTSTNVGTTDMSWMVSILAGFAAVFIASSSIGTEGKNILNMYMVPLEPKSILRAKASSTLILSLAGALIMSVVATVVFGPNLSFFLKAAFMSTLAAVQSVLVGLCFATRYSDFTPRPKPRYISTTGMLTAMLVGLGTVVATGIPIFLLFHSQFYLSIALSASAFLSVSLLAYRSALKGATALMRQLT